MKKLFYFACIMLATTFTSLLTSCGDDDKDEVENNKFTIVGTWRIEYGEETLESYKPFEYYVTFYSDSTFEYYDIYTGSEKKEEIDSEGHSIKIKGKFSIQDKTIISTQEKVYYYHDYKDWEWHEENDIESATMTFNPNDNSTFSVTIITEEEGTITNKYVRVK